MFADPLADGRTVWAKRWNDLVLLHASDLGGFGMVSEAQLSVCKRCATLETMLEKWEGEMSIGQPVDADAYGRVAGRLARLFELIGIKRIARPVDPMGALAKSLEAYAQKPIDDDDDGNEDEELPIEAGFDKSEPGEA